MARKCFRAPSLHAYVMDTGGGWTIASLGLMLLSSILRLCYFLFLPQPVDTHFLHLILPLAASAAFISAVAFFGDRTAAPTVVGVLLGVVFFALKAQSFTPLHQTLCTILYLGVAVLYSLTVTDVIPTKKLLYPLFGLPLLYHIFVEDTQYYFFASPPVPFVQWLPEMSVLCIMAALLCASFALRRRDSAADRSLDFGQ